MDCVSSTPWCKSGANLVHWAGTSLMDLTSLTFASVSDSYRCSSTNMMKCHMMQSPTSQATATMGAGSLMTGTGNLGRYENCHTIVIAYAVEHFKSLSEQEHNILVVHFIIELLSMHTEFTDKKKNNTNL